MSLDHLIFALSCLFAVYVASRLWHVHKLLRDYRLPLPELPADEPAAVDKGGNAHQRRIQRRAEQRRDKLARV